MTSNLDKAPVERDDLPVERVPSIVLAVFVESVPSEADGTFSLIHIIDKLTLSQDEPHPDDVDTVVSTNLVVGFRAPDLERSSGTLSVRPRKPSGREAASLEIPVGFEGRSGTNLVIDLDVIADEEGIYWFDLFLNDQFVTSTPLEIVFQREPESASSESASEVEEVDSEPQGTESAA